VGIQGSFRDGNLDLRGSFLALIQASVSDACAPGPSCGVQPLTWPYMERSSYRNAHPGRPQQSDRLTGKGSSLGANRPIHSWRCDANPFPEFRACGRQPERYFFAVKC
jgi:hypothetical protein